MLYKILHHYHDYGNIGEVDEFVVMLASLFVLSAADM